MEDGTLPHEASIEEGRIDKERRLFYEGITRAKERPRLSHTKGSTALGRHPQPLPQRAAGNRRGAEANAGFAAIHALLGD